MNGTNKNQHTQIQKQDKIHKDANTLNSNNLRKERKIENDRKNSATRTERKIYA